MLGFLSGLVFIVLCGSTSAYNALSNPNSENKPVEIVEKVLPNTEAETNQQTIGDVHVHYGRTDQGDEFTVLALDIEPSTQATVRLQDGDRVLTTKTVTADANGTIRADFEPLQETLSLAQVVELDYFENTGKAAIKLWWDAPPPTPTPTPTPTRTPVP